MATLEMMDLCRCCGSPWIEPVFRIEADAGHRDIGQCRTCYLAQALPSTDAAPSPPPEVGAAPLGDATALGAWLSNAPLLGHALQSLAPRIPIDERVHARLPYVVDAVAHDRWEAMPAWAQCFSATSLTRALADARLRLAHAQRDADDSGVWLDVWFVRDESFTLTSDDAVWLLEQEWAAGVRTPDFLRTGREAARRVPLRREMAAPEPRVAA